MRAVASRIRLMRALRGTSLLLLTLVLLGGTALFLDYLVGLSAPVRLVLLAGWLSLGALVAFFGLLRPLWRRLDPKCLAAVVEERYADLGERLMSVVELADDRDSRHGSPALAALLLEETETRTQRLDFLQAVPPRQAFRFATVAMVLLVLALSPAVLWPHYAVPLSRRFLLPWRTPGPLVFYSLEVTPGDVLTAKGRPLSFAVLLRPDHDNVTLPRTCTLVLTDAEGNDARLRMLAEGPDAFSLGLDKVTGNCSYHVEAGDAISATYQVTAIDPVELAADSPTITITPPEYARKSVDEQTIQGLADLTALQHSKIRFDFRFTRPAKTATLEWLPRTTKKDKEPKTQETTQQLVLAADGCGASCLLPALTDGEYRLVMEEEHGIRTELEPRTCTVKVDQAPAFLKVAINDKLQTGPAPEATGKEEMKIVQPYDVVPLAIAVADDVGIEKAEVEYRVNDGKALVEALPLQGAGSREASSRYVFKLADKDLKEGDIVHYRLKASDNRRVPEAGLLPHVTYYPPEKNWLTLKISGQAQPLRQHEIAEQRDEMKRRLEAIKEDLLKELRDLYKLRQEARQQSTVSSEQAKELSQLRTESRSTEEAMRELARTAAEIPPLQPLAEQARATADEEMTRSATALREAEKETSSPRRERRLQESDKEMTAALKRVEEMLRANERLAQARLDQTNLEMLSERQQRLAERTAEQAAKDPIKEPVNGNETEQLTQEQRELAKDLQRMAEQSEPVRNALDMARAQEARQMAERARELAQAERDLAQASRETRQQQKEARMAELARKQQELAERASRMSQQTRQAAQVAQAQPLKPDDAQKAAQALRQDNTGEALRLQDQAAREMDRTAKDLEQASDKARQPREAARQLARLQEGFRQRLQEETRRRDTRTPLNERMKAVQQEQEALKRAVEDLPAQNQPAQKEQREAVERATQAVESMKNQDARSADARMAQSAQALERLANQLPASEAKPQQIARRPDNARPDGTGDPSKESATPPQGLPNREQAKQARELAQQQRDLRDEVQRAMSQAAQANRVARENPAADLARQQAEVAKQAKELAGDVGKEQGQQAAATQQGQQAAQSAQQAANQLQAGALQRAHRSGKQTAQQLRQLAQQLSQSPRQDTTPQAPDTMRQARQLAQRQEEINRQLEPLAGDREAAQAQQQARQQDLQSQTGDLNKDLQQMAQQMGRSPLAQQSAQRAAESGQRARTAMQQAQDRGRQGNQGQAQESQQEAAQHLDQAAQRAEMAAQRLTASVSSPLDRATDSQPAQQTGQALQQAQGEMNQAQDRLSQGQKQAAQSAMQRASQALQQAARQIAQQPGQPGSQRQTSGQGVTPGGQVDPKLLGEDAKKYAGKRWGELPGELRTKIIQDLQAKYGEDYARIIKLYFEQIADTKK
jgi:hypothetical protein